MPRTNHQLLSIPSKKICEKKLREIKALKEKQKQQPLNAEEKNKVERESYFRAIIRTEHEKLLERLPDEIQFHILSFLDHKTRLNMLGSKYTPNMVCERLLQLPDTYNTIDKLIRLTRIVTPIIQQLEEQKGGLQKKKAYLYDALLNKRILVEILNLNKQKFYLNFPSRFLLKKIFRIFFRFNYNAISSSYHTFEKHYMPRETIDKEHLLRTIKYYSAKLIQTIEIALRHYHKMYSISPSLSNNTIAENERAILKVYANLVDVMARTP